MGEFNFFLPIAKMDRDNHTVSGYASTPAKDSDGEIITLKAVREALPDYMRWGNIREMHQLKAVGTAQQANIDEKGLFLTAKIVDPAAWDKCLEGVYKGFSIGGRKLAASGNKVTEIELLEISVVDRPANPECSFALAKSAKKLGTAWGHLVKVEKMDRTPEQKALAKMAKVVADLSKNGPPAAHDGFSLPAKATTGPGPNDGVPQAKAAGEGFKVGDYVEWSYRGATGHGKIVGVAKEGPTPDETEYRVKEYDHHTGEKNVLNHYGKALRHSTREAVQAAKKEAKKTANAALGKGGDAPGEGKLPYGHVEYADPGYQSDGQKRYPIDTEAHIRAAWNYIHKKKNAAKYSAEDAAKIRARIVRAWKDKIDKEGPPEASAKKTALAEALGSIDRPSFLTLAKGAFKKPRPKPKLRFDKSMNTAGSLSYTFDSLRQAQRCLLIEAKREGGDMKDKALAQRLGKIAEELAGVIGQKAIHEGKEAVTLTDADDQGLNHILGEGAMGETINRAVGGDPIAAAVANLMKRASKPTKAERLREARDDVQKARKAMKEARKAVEDAHKLHKAAFLAKATKAKDKDREADGEFDHAGAMEKLQKAFQAIEKARVFGKAADTQIRKASKRAGQRGQEVTDGEGNCYVVPEGVRALTSSDMATASPGGPGRGTTPPLYPVDGSVYPGKAATGNLAKFAKNGHVSAEVAELLLEKAQAEGELAALKRLPATTGGGRRPMVFDTSRILAGGGVGQNNLTKALFDGVDVGALNGADERAHTQAAGKAIGNFLMSGHFGKSIMDPAFKGMAGGSGAA